MEMTLPLHVEPQIMFDLKHAQSDEQREIMWRWINTQKTVAQVLESAVGGAGCPTEQPTPACSTLRTAADGELVPDPAEEELIKCSSCSTKKPRSAFDPGRSHHD